MNIHSTSCDAWDQIKVNGRLTPPARLGRRSFTLVELLLVIMLIALLSSMTLFALFNIMEDARIARTRAQVTKISELLMDKWEGYVSRPVRLTLPPNTNTPPNTAAIAKLYALRELMRLELPDRITDVDNGASNLAFKPWPGPFVDQPNGRFLAVRPALSQRYQRAVSAGWTTQYQGSECLYLILSAMQDGDSNGLDFFKPSEIGDIDTDGMKEILDAWGNPIEFIRWPAGFDSPLQPLPHDAVANPDQFDPLKVDPRWYDNAAAKPFAMFPLVYSAGPDKIYDIAGEVTYSASAMQYNALPPSPPYVFGPNDPYCSTIPPPAPARQVGERMDVNGDGRLSFFDNINNHLTGTNE